jgi:hypothetical protein
MLVYKKNNQQRDTKSFASPDCTQVPEKTNGLLADFLMATTSPVIADSSCALCVTRTTNTQERKICVDIGTYGLKCGAFQDEHIGRNLSVSCCKTLLLMLFPFRHTHTHTYLVTVGQENDVANDDIVRRFLLLHAVAEHFDHDVLLHALELAEFAIFAKVVRRADSHDCNDGENDEEAFQPTSFRMIAQRQFQNLMNQTTTRW